MLARCTHLRLLQVAARDEIRRMHQIAIRWPDTPSTKWWALQMIKLLSPARRNFLLPATRQRGLAAKPVLAGQSGTKSELGLRNPLRNRTRVQAKAVNVMQGKVEGLPAAQLRQSRRPAA